MLRSRLRDLKLPNQKARRAPIVWLGQSVRTTIVTKRYPGLATECWMVSLGDAIHRPRLIERVFCGDLRERLSVRGPIMLDSGGFTMMMQNRGLRVSEVAKIYDRTCADLCISLDVPAGRGERKNTRKRKYEETRANLAQLVQSIDTSKLVPVVHGADLEDIVCNCQAIADILPEPTLICIGGLVPLLRSTGRESIGRNRLNRISRQAPFSVGCDPCAWCRFTPNGGRHHSLRCRLDRFHRLATRGRVRNDFPSWNQ
jgi:hypothetical protein